MCLRQIDPTHRSWKSQLENIVIFLKLQFQKTVDKLVDSDSSDERLRLTRSSMMGLLNCESAEAYYGKVRLLESRYHSSKS